MGARGRPVRRSGTGAVGRLCANRKRVAERTSSTWPLPRPPWRGRSLRSGGHRTPTAGAGLLRGCARCLLAGTSRGAEDELNPMQIRFWGVRGSIAVPNGRMLRYGGNTSCVEVTLADGTEIILDAGTGLRDTVPGTPELGEAPTTTAKIVRVLLTPPHLAHIQGLLFFPPLFDPTNEITVYGPPAPGPNLDQRLARYLSEPLSP